MFHRKQVLEWQPKKDSNPHKQSQSLSCYLYTIRLFVKFCCRFDDSSLTTCLVYIRIRNSSTLFSKKIKIFFGRGQPSLLRRPSLAFESLPQLFERTLFNARNIAARNTQPRAISRCGRGDARPMPYRRRMISRSRGERQPASARCMAWYRSCSSTAERPLSSQQIISCRQAHCRHRPTRACPRAKARLHSCASAEIHQQLVLDALEAYVASRIFLSALKVFTALISPIVPMDSRSSCSVLTA